MSKYVCQCVTLHTSLSIHLSSVETDCSTNYLINAHSTEIGKNSKFFVIASNNSMSHAVTKFAICEKETSDLLVSFGVGCRV